MQSASQGICGAVVWTEEGVSLFIDNQGDLDALIKGYSNEETMKALLVVLENWIPKVHVCLGTAEYPLPAMLLICRRVESGKNCLRCFQSAEKFRHSVRSVPESFRR